MINFPCCHQQDLKQSSTVSNFSNVLSTRAKREPDFWKSFRKKKVPIIWIIGAPGCGRSSLARLVTYCSGYKLIDIASFFPIDKHSRQPKLRTNDTIKVIKNEIQKTYAIATGYIIDGFPRTLREAHKFNNKICKVKTVVYVYLTLDALIGRSLANDPKTNLNELRVKFVKSAKKTKKIMSHYEYKSVQIYNQFPVEDSCNRLIELLEDEFGYKFQRLPDVSFFQK